MLRYILAMTLIPAATIFSSAQSMGELFSPDKRLSMKVNINPQGEVFYELHHRATAVIGRSQLGVKFQDGAGFMSGLKAGQMTTSEKDETWQPVWGEESNIRDRYKEMKVELIQPAMRDAKMIITFRLYNEGLGFRYEWPAQETLNHFVVMDELTEFALTGDHKAWWIPGDHDTNEYTYTTSKLSEVNTAITARFTEINTRVPWSGTGVQTPLMMKSNEGLYLNIHEAALVNYPVMQLEVEKNTNKLKAHLVPNVYGHKAFLQTPAKSPWRVMNIAEKATDMLASRLILNLNEPSVIMDPSYIKPMKYVGIWWEMHVGISSWDYAGTQDGTYDRADLKPSGKHGATTARTKQYIDFAAKHGFDGVLVEGWNEGWEDWFGKWKEDVFDFVTPYPDFDLEEVNRYAKGKGVKMIMHHETSGSVTNYERWMDSAYRLMVQYGYPAVKTGYVGKIIPRGEHHDGQWMTNHFNRVAQKTADYRIMVNMHESSRPTGMHRTYPNWIACEAARGNEFNAWSSGNPPEHETILPFTRLMGGPMDYTPGIFEVKMSHYKPEAKEQVHTTLAKQLALYVTMYSPLQMAADLPENYEKYADALQFIKDVAVDWDDTRYLEAEPGDHLTIVRKAKGKNEWFGGAITDENAHTASFDLSFLDKARQWEAVIYRDGTDAHWEKNPKSYIIERKKVKPEETLKIRLAPGGGAAIQFRPL
ncbi:MAG TPA: glycoside hydrolase family 97 protein [Phnomibacter sp.]|nr:glycoside hydrolase family 97 protein [Phnomibacter sp.]